jgi:hypothetical protein
MSAAVWHETQWADTSGDRPASRGGGPPARPQEARRDQPGPRRTEAAATAGAAVGALAGVAG